MQNKPVVIALFALVACALAWLLFATPPGAKDPEKDVEKAWTSYVQAFMTGDGKKACDQLTEGARAAVKRSAADVGAEDCPDAFTRTREIGGEGVVRAVQQIQVHKVRIEGHKATIELHFGDQDSIAHLFQVDDHWKIATLPKS